MSESLRHDIVEIGRRLWQRGFVASNDGNISVRIGSDRLLMTPASVSKGFMSAEMMVITDLEGRVVEAAPGRKPSSEALMHLVVYRERPDINAVVHAHPSTHRLNRARESLRWQASPSTVRCWLRSSRRSAGFR